MRNFQLSQDFADPLEERSLLASLVADPTLKGRFAGVLTIELFFAEHNEAAQYFSADGNLDSSKFSWCSEWEPAADPQASLDVLVDLHRRRRLAELQEQLGELLYNPSRSVTEAGRLIADWEQDSSSRGSVRPGIAATDSLPLAHQVLAEVSQRSERRKANGGSPVMGIPTGLSRLDSLLNGLCTGLHVMGGAPGAGKTTLALQIAVQAAAAGYPVLYLTYENTPANLILKAVCAEASVVTLDAERGFGDLAKLGQAAGRLRPALERLSVVEGTLRLSAADVRRLASEWYKGRRGLMVVDYLQRAAHQHGYDQMRQSVSRLAAELREIATALDSPVLALASQNRSGGDYGRGSGSAQLDSLKESGDLEYAADSVMFLRADRKRVCAEPVRAIEIAVVKNRFGPLGTVPLQYRPDIGYLRDDSKEPAHPLLWSQTGEDLGK